MKTLKQILEVYSPKSADEKRFVKKHITVKTPDPAGNNDDVYQATNIKTIDRAKEKKGYDAKSSEAVYEESEPMVENWVVHKDGKVLKTGIKQHKTAKAHAEKLGAKVNSAEWYHDNVTSKNKQGVAKEETQIDELSKTTLGSYIKKASRDRGMHGIEAGAAGYKSKEQKSSIDKMKQRQAGVVKAVGKMTEEHQDLLADIDDALTEEMLNEVLAKNADAGEWISDFVKSDNPKFAGKSKAKRIKMALGAYYSKQRGE